ncbi:MAG: hypothetical protein AB8B65_12115 [Kordia sp.]|uniref:hypothetical protein n=1 Tax=Kordia sp. TaxID=1965332 RepID=UPI003858569F
MKKIVFILIGIVLVGCGSTKSKTKPKLPPKTTCAEDAKIYDQDSSFELNTLTSLDSLSYATTYIRFSTQTDSLEKDQIRYKLGKTSQKVALKVFPTIQLTDASILLGKNYNEIVGPILRLKDGEARQEDFEVLAIPNNNTDLQLFIEVQSYAGDGIFVNYISIFVMDTKKQELKYYDFIKYKCDPRDETMFMKTLYYGINKLKNSIK